VRDDIWKQRRTTEPLETEHPLKRHADNVSTTHYEDAGSENDCWSNPQSHKLYAMNMARQEDSMGFVLRNAKPMIVRKKKEVNAIPKSMADSGDDAAAGNA
jgi:hypothetical protein